ncbi:DEAD/DEAH box helicase [Streptomyces sp. NPDC006267]|uniref:DEAD/DEAH box helicase n=1 Tax=Streptomyces sp. NPDC006267 TaxID=3157173 RepID=UPI0033BB0578
MPKEREPGVRDRQERTAAGVSGRRELWPGQSAAMEAVMAGRDTLVVMPTSAGKSAVYRVTGLSLPGPAVVVSPRIALQRDQIAGLLSHDTPDAVAVNSAQSTRESKAAWAEVQHRAAEFLFLSPEQLTKNEVIRAASRPSPVTRRSTLS